MTASEASWLTLRRHLSSIHLLGFWPGLVQGNQFPGITMETQPALQTHGLLLILHQLRLNYQGCSLSPLHSWSVPSAVFRIKLQEIQGTKATRERRAVHLKLLCKPLFYTYYSAKQTLWCKGQSMFSSPGSSRNVTQGYFQSQFQSIGKD